MDQRWAEKPRRNAIRIKKAVKRRRKCEYPSPCEFYLEAPKFNLTRQFATANVDKSLRSRCVLFIGAAQTTYTTRQPSDAPSFAELFTSKLIIVVREGYGPAQLRAINIAGLTIAIMALPLSMAAAIAAGATPAQGLHTAIIGGFIVRCLADHAFSSAVVPYIME